MKVIFYALIAVMLFSSATCRKAQPGTNLAQSILGEWQYIGKSGGYAGKQEKADPEKQFTLQFKKDFRYDQKINNQVSEQGSYELYKVKSIYSGKEEDAIRFHSSTNPRSINSVISLRNDTLTIADNVYDGFTMEYIKVR